ncbi:MAG: MMPL family transporter, partial [Gammaproteobacteria bacterium]|nr:MMPL family transporter [Gammaproteobacteria bacterium]
MKIINAFKKPFVTAELQLLRYPRLLLLMICIACGLSLYYTIENLRIDTDTTRILSSKLPFQQDRQRLLKAFPQDDQAILVVVDADSPELTSRALSYLGAQFSKQTQQIELVYIPGEEPFFKQNGLLYLELEDVEELAAKLAEAQPFIGKLGQDNSLKNLLSIIELAINTDERELPVDLNPLLNKIQTAIQAVAEGNDYQLSWQQLMLGENLDLLTTQRFILLKPKLDYSSLTPAENPLKVVRAITDNAAELYPETTIRLTGEVVLEHEEMEIIRDSTQLALLFSMTLVCIALMLGFRSVRLTVATLTVLLMGLMLTAGFATLAIGRLNLISIAFSILYIGIGVDYAIQLCLRYQELLQQGVLQQQALRRAIHQVAPSITLCAITTSVGFFSFIPTAYTGVSELGMISGVGMFIALLITLTALPALLKIMPLRSVRAKTNRTMLPEWIYFLPLRHQSLIKWTSLLLTIAAIGFLTRVSFDFNPLNLRDPNSESVSTFKVLLKSRVNSPMTLTVLASSKTDALNRAQQLKQLKSVENAITIFDFIPDDQDDKLAIIEGLSLLLGVNVTSFPAVQDDSLENQRLALNNLQVSIKSYLASHSDSALSESLGQLEVTLSQYLVKLKSESPSTQKALFNKLQTSLLDTLPDTMNLLFKGLGADYVSLDSLPEELSERWLNKDGIYRIMVFPREDLNEIDNLKEFITDVRQLEPNATDLPVIYLETGNAVVTAFQQALIGALLAIFLVVMIIQRSIKDTLLILLPLLMAAIMTGASTVL